MTTEAPVCTNPECARPIKRRKLGPRNRNNGWRRDREGRCESCHERWVRNGRPPEGPGAPQSPGQVTGAILSAQAAQRRQQARQMHAQGIPRDAIALRLGLSPYTVSKYLRPSQPQGETPMSSDAMAAGSAWLGAPTGAHDERPAAKPVDVERINGRPLKEWETGVVAAAREEERVRDWERLFGKKEAA